MFRIRIILFRQFYSLMQKLVPAESVGWTTYTERDPKSIEKEVKARAFCYTVEICKTVALVVGMYFYLLWLHFYVTKRLIRTLPESRLRPLGQMAGRTRSVGLQAGRQWQSCTARVLTRVAWCFVAVCVHYAGSRCHLTDHLIVICYRTLVQQLCYSRSSSCNGTSQVLKLPRKVELSLPTNHVDLYPLRLEN
jgi:hypothetical protein